MAQVKYKSRDELEKELEELKSRTCMDCKLKPKEGESYSFTCGQCSRFYPDEWEEKR